MYKRLSSKILLSHPRLTVAEDQIELPGGKRGDYVWFDGGQGAVTIIARDDEGRVLVEREYSYLPNEAIYQFAGGGMNRDEAPEAAANRELMEELDMHAERLIPIGAYLMDHRRSYAVMHVFIGEGLTARASESKDVYEVDLSASWLSEREIDTLISEGKIVNATMLACWTIYKNWRIRQGAVT